jgi:hypothetical protein
MKYHYPTKIIFKYVYLPRRAKSSSSPGEYFSLDETIVKETSPLSQGSDIYIEGVLVYVVMRYVEAWCESVILVHRIVWKRKRDLNPCGGELRIYSISDTHVMDSLRCDAGSYMLNSIVWHS